MFRIWIPTVPKMFGMWVHTVAKFFISPATHHWNWDFSCYCKLFVEGSTTAERSRKVACHGMTKQFCDVSSNFGSRRLRLSTIRNTKTLRIFFEITRNLELNFFFKKWWAKSGKEQRILVRCFVENRTWFISQVSWLRSWTPIMQWSAEPWKKIRKKL